MAENKIGPNLQAGAGFLAKRVQKSLNRAQEKVSPEKHPYETNVEKNFQTAHLTTVISLPVPQDSYRLVLSCL